MGDSSFSSALLTLPLMACLSAAEGVTEPSAHLGRPLGADFELADWEEVSSYFEGLGRESARVLVETVGQTTEGRDFLLATISSEANLARLDEIREAARRMADPRGLGTDERARLVADGVPIVFISCAMHATETAAPQFAMEFAHALATSEESPWKEAREELVVLIAPSLNPDGQDHVVSWYRETVGTPYESTELLKLYQYYSGHDNNRDWFGLTQNETRIVTELLYSVWHPTIYWDVHQQGSSRERFFVPPYRDPLNPNLDSGIIAAIGALGGRALFDLTAEGKTGVSTGVTYDMWWNGGNRNVPVRHNIVGILTEAASVNIASPIFLQPDRLGAPRGLGEYGPSNRFPAPWPGGWWRLRDIIDYELAFGRSLLGSLVREPETWIENAVSAAERAIERGRDGGPRAWLIPSDNRDRAAVRRLVETLLLGGVEVFRATAEFEADGRTWPAETLVLPTAQPYGAHVQDLFEVQRYPEGEPPYDVAGWTLPLLFGVRRVEVMGEFEASLEPVAEAAAAVERFPGSQRGAEDVQNGDVWRRAVAALYAGESAALGTGEKTRGRLRTGADPDDGPSPVEESSDDDPWRELSAPRIGVYAPWRGSMDEGWMRWVLDEFEVPYVRVRNEMLRAGRLEDFLDVLVVPSISGRALDDGRNPGTVHPEYARGLDPEGAVAVEEFVRDGGSLITMGSSAAWAIELFDLPLADVTQGDEAGEFSCPGSVLRALPVEHDLTAGLPASVALFFSRSAAWELDEEADDERELDVLLRYAPTRVLYSGWIREPEVIADRAAWVRAEHGEGEVHLFAFRPQYRGWSQDAFELLFRALFG